jgi:hypothetical protein
MWFGILTLATALIISVSAAYYSILGLTAIFASAFWPIVILGSSLEVGKIVSTLWLHKYWLRAEMQYKIYLSAAVAILMVLTSMGVFGFLSKAHLDQAVPSGDIQAQVQIYDDKIKTQRDNIEAARKALRQMDEAVDQTMSRSSSEQGADKAASLRRSQARERGNLQTDISRAQAEIVKLQEARAPVASQARQVEAEVGPIKYIAALIYGDNPDANLLEKAVRWVIILIVIVFDPLALTLLLAATKTFEWERGINVLALGKKDDEVDNNKDNDAESWFTRARDRARFWHKKRVNQNEEPSTFISTLDHSEPVVDRQNNTDAENEYFGPSKPKYEPDDGPLTDEQLNQIRAQAKNDLPTGQVITKQSLLDPEATEFFDRARKTAQAIDAGTYEPPEQEPVKKRSILTGLDNMWSRAKKIVTRDSESEHAPLIEPLSNKIEQYHEQDQDDITDPLEKEAQRRWKLNNPRDTIKHWRKLHANGRIAELPWNHPDYYPELRPELGLLPDNLPDGKLGEVKGFGTAFPTNANKGDMFLRVDQLPSLLYKFNGSQWIEVDKNQSDQHAYNNAYIDHLIEKIGTGEYDPDLLSDAERDSIEHRLKQTSNLT